MLLHHLLLMLNVCAAVPFFIIVLPLSKAHARRSRRPAARELIANTPHKPRPWRAACLTLRFSRASGARTCRVAAADPALLALAEAPAGSGVFRASTYAAAGADAATAAAERASHLLRLAEQSLVAAAGCCSGCTSGRLVLRGGWVQVQLPARCMAARGCAATCWRSMAEAAAARATLHLRRAACFSTPTTQTPPRRRSLCSPHLPRLSLLHLHRLHFLTRRRRHVRQGRQPRCRARRPAPGLGPGAWPSVRAAATRADRDGCAAGVVRHARAMAAESPQWQRKQCCHACQKRQQALPNGSPGRATLHAAAHSGPIAAAATRCALALRSVLTLIHLVVPQVHRLRLGRPQLHDGAVVHVRAAMCSGAMWSAAFVCAVQG